MLRLFYWKMKKQKSEDEPAVSHGQRQCMVCQAKLRGYIKRHVLIAHLPWYTDPTAAC